MARDAALDYIDEVKRLYRERTGANDLFPAEEPRLLTSGESQPPQDAYSYELARLNAANGTDLTRTVSAFDVRPQAALLAEPLATTASDQVAYDEFHPDSVLEAFLPAKNYIREDGTFQLEVAKADYSNIFLPTVPEKNRIYLQQAADAVDYLITDDPRILLGYDAKTDAVVYNPNNQAFSNYDWDNVITHELAHRIDRWFVNSPKNEAFKKEIATSKYVSPRVWESLARYCWGNDKEGYFSDIVAALSESKYDLPFYHEKNYWSEEKKVVETFANLFSLETLGDVEKMSILKKTFPRLLQAYETMDFSL